MKRPNDLAPDPQIPPLAATETKRVRIDPIITTNSGANVVLTGRLKMALEKLELAYAAKLPALIEGAAGVGKSILVESFAAIQNQTDIVTINMGEQTDAKALVGLYAADENRPGFFRWIAGVLTEALRKGSWLVIEDSHLASMEILSVLVSVVESRKLFLHSTGETIVAAESFRVFATKTRGTGPNLFEEVLGSLWYRLALDPASDEELFGIIESKYDQVSCVDLVLKIHNAAAELVELARCPLVRRMFRFCDRLQVSTVQCSSLGLDEESREFLLLEAYEVYGAHLSKMQSRHIVVKMLADLLYITEDRVVSLVFDRHPELSFSIEALQIGRVTLSRRPLGSKKEALAPTKLSRQVLERVALSVASGSPALLVGETGTGKTTLVQELARLTGQGKLAVLNMSQQTEASDLLGGFRPLSAKVLAKSLFDAFDTVFKQSIQASKNEVYFQEVLTSFQKQNWPRFVKLIRQVGQALLNKTGPSPSLQDLLTRLDAFEKQSQFMKNNVLFGYVEGSLVEAIREGHWILLDEINLASSETLEVLSGLLRSTSSSIHLSERGDSKPIERHPNFRLFACMNPATDVSKKDLPPSIRHKFNEIYVDETDVYPDDLKLFIEHSVGNNNAVGKEVIAALYYQFKEAIAKFEFVDGSNHKPLLNLRTLNRALKFAKRTQGLYGFQRALYEGFCLSFTTTLGPECRSKALSMLATGLSLANVGPLKPTASEVPRFTNGAASKLVDGYILALGGTPVGDLSRFVLTPSVKRNVSQLSRAIMAASYPMLLEGPTSSGKTSVVEYLALMTGHKFMRINNHEHTDIQEYLGAYQPDAKTGQLVFKEGLLVEALRNGYWLVLDELNLAPSDVLEALNRLLDDNRELYVPELNEIVRPHPEFLLFATQNPAGSYGGRKVLSRAFRSRFLELQVDDLPVDEVEKIIEQRCRIAPSYAKKIGQVYKVLQEKRQAIANVFAGRHALITLRDLFRWALRAHDDILQLADNGYLVLAERIRHEEEKHVIRETIESICKVKIDTAKLYDLERMTTERKWPLDLGALRSLDVTWTKAMQRSFSLVYQCYLSGEPVLLAGETGCGKTTACQILAQLLDTELSILNCHQNTETSDILGCLRPTRSSDSNAMFTWYDGPLVQAMRQGQLFLLDEISLAEDSVLERLNSVLEPHGTLVLAEYIGGDGYANQVIKPADGFAMFGTMNPGGDYGKKELSPALRNRFTEIWVPSIGDDEDLRLIIASSTRCTNVPALIVEFLAWWKQLINQIPFLNRWIVSLRDILTWARFTEKFSTSIDESLAFIHAAMMLFVDPALSRAQREDVETVVGEYKEACLVKLVQLCGLGPRIAEIRASLRPVEPSVCDSRFGIDPFYIPIVKATTSLSEHTLTAPTTLSCTYRVLRAMQLGTAILLEGSPGVGKTTLIETIAKITGHNLVRINLSDQTDLIDLFGTDLPVEGGSLGKFQWCDGPFLRALKRGDWILLDELNLASQSVLEGLNACLDHRGSVYIPELNMTFEVSPLTRIFAAQNPLRQGGGRKGLPKSFVNRFITVWFDQLQIQDYRVICEQAFPDLSIDFLHKAIEFNSRLLKLIDAGFASKGRPWEFNLRDLFRWMKLARHNKEMAPEYFRTIYLGRLRTHHDRETLAKLFEQVFCTRFTTLIPYHVADSSLVVGNASISMAAVPEKHLLMRSQLGPMESLMLCVQHSWLSVLVGPTGSGKTSVARLLAELSHVPLVEFNLGPDTDTLELLGSFEQSDYERKYQNLAAKYGVPRDGLESTDNEVLREEFASLRVEEETKSAQFEWVDGPLTKALLQGHWIVLENANVCSPAVLDRLNSLFEPNGSLSLNEASGAELRIIKPHPSFRIFMTVDPKYGELSRAMRNRGVEIALIERPGMFDRFDLASSVLGTNTGLQQVAPLVVEDCRDAKRNLEIFSILANKFGPDSAITKFDLMVSGDSNFWLQQSNWPKSFFKSPTFAFSVQKGLLSAWLSDHTEALQTIPAILAFISWASPLDWNQRLTLLKDLAPQFYEKISGLQPDCVPTFGLDLSCSEEFCSRLAAALFYSPTPSDIIATVSPLKRAVHAFTVDQLAWKAEWELLSAHFGFRNEATYQLAIRIGRLSSDKNRLMALFNNVNRGNDDCLADLESSLEMAEKKAQNMSEAKKNALQLNVNQLENLRSLMSATSDDLYVDGPVSKLCTIEHLVKEFCPLTDLVITVTSTTLYYTAPCAFYLMFRLFMDGVTLEDMASTEGLLESQKQLIEAVLQLDLSLDKQAFVSNLIKAPIKDTKILVDEVHSFVAHFVDPVTAYYAPLNELGNKLLCWQESSMSFQQLFQDFYYGHHQEDTEGVIEKTHKDIEETTKFLRYRSADLTVERIKGLLQNLSFDKLSRENLLSVFTRLRTDSVVPSDLTAGPLFLLGQILCNLIKEQPEASYESLLVSSNGKWTHRTMKQLMVALEFFKVARLLGAKSEGHELLFSLAEKLSNVSSRRPTNTEDPLKLFDSCHDDSATMNIKVAQTLMDLDRKFAPGDLENLAEIVAKHCPELVTARLSALLMSKLARPHTCDGKQFNHLCPQTLQEVISTIGIFESRLIVLLELYPEHDLLQSLQKMCEKARLTPVKEATLFAVSSQVEYILSKVHVWQSICSKSDSLEEPIDQLMDVLFKVRKLEMESWKNLAGHLSTSYQRDAYSLWGWLTKLLLSNVEDMSALLGVLDTFLMACPAGEFQGRLNLLRHILSYEGITTSVRTLSENCLRYYSLYSGPLETHLTCSAEPVLQELKGFLATIRWNDKNIFAHVESSKKVHSQVIKAHKGLQDIYQMPISVLIAKLKSQPSEKTEKAFDVSNDYLMLPDLDFVTKGIFERMGELKKMTTKDSIKMKQNAIVELFKLFKHLGIKLHKQYENMSIKSLILALPQVPNDDVYLFKTLQTWNEIQTLLTDPHDDNVLRQIEIFKTAIIQLVHYLAQAYSPYQSVVEQVASLKRLPRNIGVALECPEADRVTKLLSMNKVLFQEISIFSKTSFGTELEFLDQAISMFSDSSVVLLDSEQLAWITGQLHATSTGFPLPKNCTDMKGLVQSIQKNSKRLLVLLSRAQPVEEQSFELPVLPSVSIGDCEEFDVPSGTLRAIVDYARSVPLCDLTILKQVTPQVYEYSDLLISSLTEIEIAGRKLSKFAYVISSVFAELLRNGYCRPAEESKDQEGDATETTDGMGMADGQGEKDVSKEIEFEEQVTDLANDKREEPAESPEKSEDHGLDMEQDFEAQLEDLVDEAEEDGSGGDDKDDEKQAPKDEAGDHEGVEDQDQMEIDLDQDDLDELSADENLEKLESDTKKELGKDKNNKMDENDQDNDGDECDENESDTDVDEEMEDSDADLDLETDNFDIDGLDEDMEKALEDTTDDQPGQEEEPHDQMEVDSEDEPEDEKPVDTSREAKQAGETAKEHDEPMQQEGELGGDHDQDGEMNQPNDSKVSDSKADESADQSMAKPLDEILENIFKSVHSILEEDKSREKSQPTSMDFSRQQQFEHSADVDNQIGLVAPTADLENRLEEKVEYSEQQDANMAESQGEEQEEPMEEAGETQMGLKKTGAANVDTKDESFAMQEEQCTYDWDRLDADVSNLASELCEQLRLVLEPTKASKMKGDYKTGKRLNLRKLIPYIISQYRKDKIWLRRTKPSKRTYRIALSVDNSRSMKDNGCELLALKSVALVSQALSKLEAGKVAIVGFGDTAEEILPFCENVSVSAIGAKLASSMTFNSNSTNVVSMMETVIETFELGQSNEDFNWNLNLIISDGICENHDALQVKLNEALSKRIMNIFVILDNKPASDSISELSQIEYVNELDARGLPTGRTNIKMKKYLESFPFENYVIVKDVRELPLVLSDSIRQWFELLSTIE